MHIACQSTAGIFEYLLEVGGSIFNRDSDGVSVIECSSNNPEIYRLLRKKCVIGGSMNQRITIGTWKCYVMNVNSWKKYSFRISISN